MSPEQLQAWLNLGVGGLMLAALFLGFRAIWVWGWIYRQVMAERDEWKDMALKGLQAAGDVAEVAAQHTTLTPKQAELARRLIRSAGRDNDVAEDG